jgi:aminopeptidase N
LNRRTALKAAGVTAAVGAGALAGAGRAAATTNDPYYPSFGDWRYNVSLYDIGDTVIVAGVNTRVTGATTMTATANTYLTSLEIDFALVPSRITVNGVAVRWSRTSWRKIVVTGLAIAAGARFTIHVRYDDYPVRRNQAAYYQPGAQYGDGLMYTSTVVDFFGEPNGAVYWYPCNDKLTNKATYKISVSTQRGYNVAGSGILTSRYNFTSNGRAMTNVKFVINQPAHSWMPSLHVGAISQQFATWYGPNREAVWTTISTPQGLAPNMSLMRITQQALTYFSRLYGPYPFDRAGGFQAPSNRNDYWALENMGIPTYVPAALANVYQGFVAHENAHQWFGNSVTVTSWKDVVLIQEGIASLLQWDYLNTFAGASSQFPFNTSTISSLASNPTPANMYSQTTYQSAFALMRELRRRMDGSIYQTQAPRFTAFLRGIARDFRYGYITRDQFKARAQQATPNSLSSFWSQYGI